MVFDCSVEEICQKYNTVIIFLNIVTKQLNLLFLGRNLQCSRSAIYHWKLKCGCNFFPSLYACLKRMYNMNLCILCRYNLILKNDERIRDKFKNSLQTRRIIFSAVRIVEYKLNIRLRPNFSNRESLWKSCNHKCYATT